MNPVTVAIDPGRSGGIAVRWPDGRVTAWTMPDTDADTLVTLREIIATARREGWQASAVVEKVGGYVGGKGQPGSAMFTFGESFGFLCGCLMALGIPLRLVRPQQWQAALQLGKSTGHASKAAWKRHLRAEAARRFPQLRPTLATADALLLLDAAAILSGTANTLGQTPPASSEATQAHSPQPKEKGNNDGTEDTDGVRQGGLEH